MGASFAAAGMIAATAEMADAPPAEIAFAGRARALWPGFAAEVEATSGLAVGYRQDGALMLEPRPAILPPGTQWLDGAAARAQGTDAGWPTGARLGCRGRGAGRQPRAEPGPGPGRSPKPGGGLLETGMW